MQYNLPILKSQTNKRYLVRCDLNVPRDKGIILDDTRIKMVAPTLKLLLGRNNKVIILSHFGRPKGKFDQQYSVHFLSEYMQKYFPQIKLHFASMDDAPKAIDNMNYGEILLLENVRFYPGEEANDEEFAKKLADLGDIYVNEAFSVCHRAHASVCAITNYLPSFAGLELQRELTNIAAAIKTPKRPLCAIFSGAKISTKLPILHNLLPKVDKMLVGGGIACTLLAAKGQDMANSIVEKEMLDDAKSILVKYQDKIVLPVDYIAAKSIDATKSESMLGSGDLPADYKVLDIGPETVTKFSQALQASKTLLWNGPLGYFENPTFAKGTHAIAEVVSELTAKGELFSVVGGGETVGAIAQLPEQKRHISYTSTAGGAFLELCSGSDLPGIKALQ